MKNKLLTIAIPVYKRYDSLYRLLKQIDDQIKQENLAEEIEVLICDDSGCIKQNFELIIPFLSENYFHYIDNGENIGIINNILKVIEESSGKYCLSPGDDEELLENKLIECVKVLRNLTNNIAAVIFDKELLSENIVLNCFETAERYFWYFGNLGCFVVNTEAVKDHFSCNKRNTIWPQTELIFLAALEKNYDFFIVKNQIMHSFTHRVNTRYNSYYILEAGFVSLIKTALNFENIKFQNVAIRNINNREKKLLIPLLLQYIFNDRKQDTKKTRKLIVECKTKFRPYIFDKTIYRFNLLSRIPKILYKVYLKTSKKYSRFEYIQNVDKKNKTNDEYT